MMDCRTEQEAWSLHQEWMNAGKPTASQTFMAEEGMNYLIENAFSDSDRVAARYNLASLYTEIDRFDLAEKLLKMNLQEEGDELSTLLLAKIYLYGDAEYRDPEAAKVILETLVESSGRNLLLYDAILQSEEGMNLPQAIHLINPVMEEAMRNAGAHPFQTAEALFHAARVDWYGLHDPIDALSEIQAAKQFLMTVSERERTAKLNRHLSAEILDLSRELEMNGFA